MVDAAQGERAPAVVQVNSVLGGPEHQGLVTEVKDLVEDQLALRHGPSLHHLPEEQRGRVSHRPLRSPMAIVAMAVRDPEDGQRARTTKQDVVLIRLQLLAPPARERHAGGEQLPPRRRQVLRPRKLVDLFLEPIRQRHAARRRGREGNGAALRLDGAHDADFVRPGGEHVGHRRDAVLEDPHGRGHGRLRRRPDARPGGTAEGRAVNRDRRIRIAALLAIRQV
mmetsp:Transcript_100191/g.306244  ORF Transcript_100191/g.306244 Transcript_100191/m.306244 type:complete len:224 (-) Transcript_100191:158-829(-)